MRLRRATRPASQTHVRHWAPIVKPHRPWPIESNLTDCDTERAAFSWETARRALENLPGGRGLNIAYEAVDRHAAGAGGRTVAIRWLGRAGGRQEITYDDLRRETSRFGERAATPRRGQRRRGRHVDGAILDCARCCTEATAWLSSACPHSAPIWKPAPWCNG